jgi:hypothetical protein
MELRASWFRINLSDKHNGPLKFMAASCRAGFDGGVDRVTRSSLGALVHKGLKHRHMLLKLTLL